jgi:hypothetical protein
LSTEIKATKITKMPEPAIFLETTSIVNKIEIESSKKDRRREEKKKHVEDGILWFLGINRAVVTDTSLMLRDSVVLPKHRFAAWAAPLLVDRWLWGFV